MKSIFASAVMTGLASAHSWVHCTDYRGDNVHYQPEQCFGNPRPLDGRVPGMTPFGTDTGFNQQPGATKCHSTEATHESYPMAKYQRGQQITLAWPPKNHVAADCTNPYIPDTALELFVAPFTSTTADNTWEQVSASFSEDPHVNGQIDFKGFQNCPDFCNDKGAALCTGTFIVPDTLADGTYTFQWRWEFNRDTSPYVTCFEAQVDGDFDGTIPVPTPRPTIAGETAKPTAQPENCGSEWQQCGGSAESYTCCRSGLSCFKKDDWYSQCRTTCPEDATWECAQTGPAPTQQPTGEPTNEATNAPTEEATPAPPTDCVSTRVQFGGSPKKHNANDSTHCWEKCQANKTKNNEECLGWEWVEGTSKPCRLYTEASTSIAGLRNCHPTQGELA